MIAQNANIFQVIALFEEAKSLLSGKGLARCGNTTPPVSSPSPSELLVRFSLKQLAQ